MFKKWQTNRALSAVQAELAESVAVSQPDVFLSVADLRQIIFPSTTFFYAGPPILQQFFAVQDQTMAMKEHILQLAAGLAAATPQTVFRPIARAAEELGQPIREVEVDPIAEVGVTGKLDRTWYFLGNDVCMQEEQVELGVTVQRLVTQFEQEGKYTLFLAQKSPKRLLGIFACMYPLLSDAAEQVEGLRKNGLEVVILTKSTTPLAQALGRQLAVPLIHSELDVESKGQVIQTLNNHQKETGLVEASGNPQLPLRLRLSGGTIDLANLGELNRVLAHTKKSLKHVQKKRN